MKGSNFVTNDKGEKVAVIIDLKKHGELWEDLYDGAIAHSRKDETSEFLKTVKSIL